MATWLALLLSACAVEAPGDTGVAIGFAWIDVTVGAETGAHVPEAPFLFEVAARSSGAAHEASCAPGETVSFEVNPGTWELDASYDWHDPEMADTDLDTGGYRGTFCSAEQETAVAAGDRASVVLTARCSDEFLD